MASSNGKTSHYFKAFMVLRYSTSYVEGIM